MKPDLSDILVIIGICLVGLGAYMIYPPAAALIVGSFSIIAGLFSAKTRAHKGGEKT